MVTRSEKKSRVPGPPVEIFIYVNTVRVGRSWKRQLIRNVTVSSDPVYAFEGLPWDRYRVEYRDARGWLASVEVWIVDETGIYRVPPGVSRQRGRTVPWPAHLPGPNRFKPRTRPASKPSDAPHGAGSKRPKPSSPGTPAADQPRPLSKSLVPRTRKLPK